MCHLPDSVKVIACSHNRANNCTGGGTHHELGGGWIDPSLGHGFQHARMERNADSPACP
jgi:hypothetical protein